MEVKNIRVGEKYTDKQGQEKTTWETIGKFFIGDDGKEWLVIKKIPVGWDGRAMIFKEEPKTQNVNTKQAPANVEAPF